MNKIFTILFACVVIASLAFTLVGAAIITSNTWSDTTLVSNPPSIETPITITNVNGDFPDGMTKGVPSTFRLYAVNNDPNYMLTGVTATLEIDATSGALSTDMLTIKFVGDGTIMTPITVTANGGNLQYTLAMGDTRPNDNVTFEITVTLKNSAQIGNYIFSAHADSTGSSLYP